MGACGNRDLEEDVSLAALIRERNGWAGVLFWAGIELIWFVVACVALGFGFVTQCW